MIFTILNRKEATKFTCLKSHIIISITDPKSKEVKFQNLNNCKGILRLQFHDWTKRDKVILDKKLIDEGYIFFSMEMANQIVEFVRKWRNKIQLIMIHCEAGISRSAAVGAAITKCLGRSDMYFYKYYHPNDLVYEDIIEAWNGLQEEK